ncbi:MAG: Oxidoreductase protein [uncultured bacterium]|nr:MAG: Oxidoreductase protein [uncultured bacterium]OGT34473.1 MAG: hypothetical protein A3C44_01100 [Gammaproteobacteria bacterium RIFCSPHIGHO2_02_FULL_39_13]OGT48528.1 MAG: hypothetical protein A3E53_04025 [Gammaproteobacteria bacterium RIFCSPHIGHO2_12_FULL_39_24]
MYNCLVIGYGSIGKRHASTLTDLGCQVSLVTQQTIPQYPFYQSIENALAAKKTDYIVIANATSLHESTLVSVLNTGFTGKMLVEKPLFSNPININVKNTGNIFVGYNLRFNETLSQLKRLLIDEQLISFSARVGQYLPTWRSNSDYKNSYSAKKKEGGGVLRDLSHELDYAAWICGDAESVTALGGKFSELEIDSDDTYSILQRTQKCSSVMIHLDYLGRIVCRQIYVQTTKHTYFADLINHMLFIDDRKIQHQNVNTYRKQHVAMLTGDFEQLCSYEQGNKIVKLINKIEQANRQGEWV